MAAADFGLVYPGGVRPIPLSRFLMKYQKAGSNSSRACSSRKWLLRAKLPCANSFKIYFAEWDANIGRCA